MNINFEYIATQNIADRKQRAIQSEINRVGPKNISLTNCLLNTDRGGLLVMQQLHHIFLNTRDLDYRLKVLCDKWGKKVKPGDVISIFLGTKTRDSFGNKISNQEKNDLKRRGELGKVEVWKTLTVCPKGTVKVNFEEAAQMLSNNGYCKEFSTPITSMPERDEFVTFDSMDKEYRKPLGQQHYWLYSEISTEEYENILDLKVKKD